MIVNVYNAEKIGTLVDTFLRMSGVTLKGFEWAPFEVKYKIFRKSILSRQRLKAVCKKLMDYVNRWDCS